MPSAERLGPGVDEVDVKAELSSVNAVFTLSLLLTQASSPAQLIRLVTTAIPSIARCQRSPSSITKKRAPPDAAK